MRDIVLPQCERGIVIAFIFAFLITAGDYVTPRFVGGGAAMMGHFIEAQFSFGFNWPMGSAMAFTVMARVARWSCSRSAALLRRGCGHERAFVAICCGVCSRSLVVVFMAMPLLLVVLFSFNRSALTSLPLTGFTLDWYRRLFANGSFWPALQNSLIVALRRWRSLSVATGTLAALALARRMRGARARRRSSACSSVPMMLPALIIGIALLCYFVRLLDLPLSLGTVILGHLVIAQPFVILIVYARLATFDWSVVEARAISAPRR